MKLNELAVRRVPGTRYPDVRINPATDGARRRAVAGEPRGSGTSGTKAQTTERPARGRPRKS